MERSRRWDRRSEARKPLTSYNVPNASTATKTDTPIMETPVSIQVVPQQVLRDQQVIAITDALKNVSGVQPQNIYGSSYDNFIVRGFSTDFSTYRNGLRQQALALKPPISSKSRC